MVCRSTVVVKKMKTSTKPVQLTKGMKATESECREEGTQKKDEFPAVGEKKVESGET
jgi:hypothetical protein